jgi:hypothetical protein
MRPVVCLDHDGVLHAHSGYDGPCPEVDLSAIGACHRRGCAVVITSCSELGLIARELRSAGYAVQVATRREPWHAVQWQGRPDGKTVLVTPFKVWADAYLDDKGYRFAYGDEIGPVLAGLCGEPVPRCASYSRPPPRSPA